VLPAERPISRAEERVLDLRVRSGEGVVVPVEPAAALGDRGQHRKQDRPKERVVLARAHARVRVREDRGGGLAPEIVDRVARVRETPKRRGLTVDEATNKRPVLVERRAVARRMLLERKRELRAALDRERSEAERSQRLVQVRSP